MTSFQDDSTAETKNTRDTRREPRARACTRWERGRPVRPELDWARRWHGLALVAFLGVAVISGWTGMALTQTPALVMNSVADTYVKQGTPNTNQGAETLLRIQQSGNNRVLVRFDQQALEQAIGSSSIRSA